MVNRSVLIAPFLRVTPLHAIEHLWNARQEVRGVVTGHCVFWLMLEGSIEVESMHGRWTLGSGEAFLFQLTGERQVSTPKGAHWLSVSLRAVAYDVLEPLLLLPLPAQWRPDAASYGELKIVCDALIKGWGGQSAYDARTFETFLLRQRGDALENDATRAILCDGYIRALFALLWRQVANQSLETTLGRQIPFWMPQALARIRENPGIGVEELAGAIGLSRRHLGREFQHYFGVSPREFLNRRRLEEARLLLQNTDFSLPDIARLTGFAELAYFNRLFKSKYGKTPDAYRKTTRLSGGVI